MFNQMRLASDLLNQFSKAGARLKRVTENKLAFQTRASSNLLRIYELCRVLNSILFLSFFNLAPVNQSTHARTQAFYLVNWLGMNLKGFHVEVT